MSYTPHEWETGDVITATKLNELEQAVASGGGTGYDAVVYVYHSNDSSASNEVSIVSGSFAELTEMLNNKHTPNVLVEVFDELGPSYSCSSLLTIESFDSSSIKFHVLMAFCNMSNVPPAPAYNFAPVVWNSDDTVTFFD